jgi:iron-sulfur cluster protein
MSDRGDRAAEIRSLLDAEGDAVAANTRAFNEGRYEAVADLPEYEDLKSRARSIKEDAIERLPELITEVTETVEARGGHVHVAADAADANAYVAGLLDSGDRVVKSKSMTTEELDVNEHLAERGVDVVETDLGEFVLQVAEESPSHIVGPAIHKSRAEIAALFNECFDPDPPLEGADELVGFAREHLAERVRDADLGMTGANFVAADTGTLALVTSEGNARKCVTATDTHVAVAGVEKLLPRFEDIRPFAELIGRSGTGQDLTAYLSLLTPPVDAATAEFGADAFGDAADREFHLVLVDNGRLAMREDEELRETLYCIRCGACSNACANFQQVGGHAFGGETYSGGIATGWEAGVHGLDAAGEFNDLCTGCSRCVPACPVEIDVPWINEVVRDRLNRGADPDAFEHLVDGLAPDAEPGGLEAGKRLFGNIDTVAHLGSATAPLSNWLARRGPTRRLLERVAGIDRRRDLPRFRRTTLRDWFEARGGSRVPAPEAAREAVLYPDVYTNHVAVERGRAAVRVLEALGVHVRIPDVPESGRAPLSQGMVSTARRRARGVADALADHIDAGRDVVVVEPSDVAMFRDDYGHLLDAEHADRLAEHSYELLEYVYGLAHDGADLGALATTGEAVTYHGHCQQRTLGLAAYTEQVLSELGYDVETTGVECCGMAGSFGYKTDYYELSMAVGDDLAAELDGDRTVLASGTSCLDQLGALDHDPRHPIELLDPDR